ncbi:pyridoxal phosphate-dependent aminotransferase [Actinomadura sp. DC4]|uniref:pyridoxal phosphate-dependent aminotransferase n=1 Tax=Actinomadura sp. DC4 TaxID=3055069 RepID=UPI0025AF7A89|nr:pyridoxal phosphate-dependent aminotransferase [Actinomadura sp. DC4]MDN3358501.1 pyridoxal phosphate-dependent aminotransferase [Actinomadura sp. DC4]
MSGDDLVSPRYEPWRFMLTVDDVNENPREAAAQAGGAGAPAIINLSSGINSRHPPQRLVSFVVGAASDPLFWEDYDGPYGHVVGRAAVAACESLRGDGRLELGIENVIITAGAGAALSVAARGLRHVRSAGADGEPPQAIVPVPAFPMAAACLAQAGFGIAELPAAPGHRWLPSVAEVIAAATPRTRVLYLSTFNDPSGERYDGTELRQLVTWARDQDVTILHDTVSSDISCAEPVSHLLSIAAAADYLNGVVTVGGMSRSRAIPGFHVGWLIAGAALARQFARLNDLVAPSSPAIASPALLIDRLAAAAGARSGGGRPAPDAQDLATAWSQVLELTGPYLPAFPGLEEFLGTAAAELAEDGAVSELARWRASLRELLGGNAAILREEFGDLVGEVPAWHGDFSTFVELPALRGRDYLATTHRLFRDDRLQTLPAPVFGCDSAWWAERGYFTRLSFALPAETWAEGLQRLRRAVTRVG